MGNDWRIWLSKQIGAVIIGGVSMGIVFFSQIEAQCPGATLTIGGATIGVKIIIDALTNAAKHAGN